MLGVARDQGFIEEELDAIGVKAELVPMTGAGPAINEALASSHLDVGVLGDVPAVIGKASGIDTRIIAYSGLNNGASLVVGKDAKYASLKDMKGKKIATQRGAFMHLEKECGGWQHWVDALEYAVKVFGFGKVRTGFVA